MVFKIIYVKKTVFTHSLLKYEDYPQYFVLKKQNETETKQTKKHGS